MRVLTGAQQDWNTQKWYFMVFADEQQSKVKHKSEPLYDDEDAAHAAAAVWVKKNA